MIDILNAGMTGLMANNGVSIPVLLDTVIVSNTRRGVIVLTGGWWLQPWGMGDRVHYYGGGLEESNSGWAIRGEDNYNISRIAGVDDFTDNMLLRHKRNRLEMAMDKLRYVGAVSRLTKMIDASFDVGAWLKIVASRPSVDLASHVKEMAEAERLVGVVRVVDASGTSVIVFDLVGTSTMIGTNTRLREMLRTWDREFNNAGLAGLKESDLEYYIKFLSEITLYGNMFIDKAFTLKVSGDVASIAENNLKR